MARKQAPSRTVKLSTRSDKALCRFLALEHKVPVKQIHLELGWAESTMFKLLREKSAVNKLHLPPDANKVLLKIQGRMDDSAKKKRQDKAVKKKLPRAPQAVDPSASDNSGTDDIDPPPADFLFHLLSGLSMEKQWYRAFKEAEIDETALKNYARLMEGVFDKFLRTRFPTMSLFDRFILEGTVHNLVHFFED